MSYVMTMRTKIPYPTYFARNTISKHRNAGYKINFTSFGLETLLRDTDYCEYCGIKLHKEYGLGYVQQNSVSIDNINLLKELNLKDIRIVCVKCNRTKSQRIYSEFIEWCKQISDYANNDCLKNNNFE